MTAEEAISGRQVSYQALMKGAALPANNWTAVLADIAVQR